MAEGGKLKNSDFSRHGAAIASEQIESESLKPEPLERPRFGKIYTFRGHAPEIKEGKTNTKSLTATQTASLLTTRLVNDMVRGLLAGRIEHELRPSVSALLSELQSMLSGRELEVLKQSLLQARSRPHDKNIQGIITSLLNQYFDEIGAAFASNPTSINPSAPQHDNIAESSAGVPSDSNSQARLLGILRDLALELATFLERSESDGIVELHDLLVSCQNKFQERSLQMRLGISHLQSARIFLLQVAAAIFFDKLEMIMHDYLASSTDYSMVSGKVWASRYSRADYMPFLFETIASLEKQRPWLFEDKNTVARILSVQVQVKAASLKSDRMIEALSQTNKKSLESILLELKALFGIGLNCLVKNRGDSALKLFERVLTCSADAIEHRDQRAPELSRQLSRLRVQAHLCCVEAEIVDAAALLEKTPEKEKAKLAKSIFNIKSQKIAKHTARIRSELELLGLTGLAINLDGVSHTGLEGLNLWVQQNSNKEETILLFELAQALNLPEEAHAHLCSYLATMIGMEAWEGQRFAELGGSIFINSKTGSEKSSFFHSIELPSCNEQFIEEVCSRLLDSPTHNRERFLSALPLLVALCFDFADFDVGFGLAVAHRHLMSRILTKSAYTPDFELLHALIDAEVRYGFGLFKGDSKHPRNSAVALLEDCRRRELNGYYREIDRNREVKLTHAVTDFSKIEALRDLSYFREHTIIRNAILGQFVSQEIRMLTALAYESKRKSLAKEISELVIARVDQRLSISEQEVAEYLDSQTQNSNVYSSQDQQSYLNRMNVESKTLAAITIILDAAITCSVLQEEKSAKTLLQEALKRYGGVFPFLAKYIESILSANSQEGFRRRLEGTIGLLEVEVCGGELSIQGTSSGASLGFLLSGDIAKGLSLIMDRFQLISSIAQRRVVPGRCRPLQRYVIAHSWARLQHRIVGCIASLNDGLEIELPEISVKVGARF